MGYRDLKTQKEKIAFIKDQLETNDQWLVRGILAVYQRQTQDEQKTEDVRYDNGMGFTVTNASFLSSIAKQILSGRSLTPKQIAASRKSMKKYAGQLMKIAEGKL